MTNKRDLKSFHEALIKAFEKSKRNGMDMDMDEMKAGIVQALENVGVFLDTNEQEDIDIANLIDDSIQFISFIVQLEEILI